MPEQELKLTAAAQGFGDAASEAARLEQALDQVGEAAEGLGEKIEGGLGGDRVTDGLGNMRSAFEEHEKAVQADAEATAKNAAGKSDYLQILRQINPALGQLAETLINASKIAGDMASKNIDLTKGFEGLKGAILANANALKLFGAGALVAVGIYAISAALRRMREEFEAATKAIREQTEEANRLAQQQADLQQKIENLSDARREGGFNADEARDAANQARRLRERLPFLSEDAAAQAATFGRGRSTEDVERIAIAIQSGRLQVDGGMRPESRERRIEAALERHADAIEAAAARERAQAGEETSAARGQLGRGGGSNRDLQNVASRFTEGTGFDPAMVAALAQIIGDQQIETFERVTRGSDPGDFRRQALERLITEQLAERGVKVEGPIQDAAIELARQLREFLLGAGAQRFEEAAKKLGDAADRLNVGGGGQTTVNDFRGSRVVLPSRRAGSVSNGQTVMEGAR